MTFAAKPLAGIDSGADTSRALDLTRTAAPQLVEVHG